MTQGGDEDDGIERITYGLDSGLSINHYGRSNRVDVVEVSPRLVRNMIGLVVTLPVNCDYDRAGEGGGGEDAGGDFHHGSVQGIMCLKYRWRSVNANFIRIVKG